MVKIIKDYYDTTMNMKLIKAGAELDVPAEREKVLIEAGVAEKIKVEEPAEIVETKEKTKNKNKK